MTDCSDEPDEPEFPTEGRLLGLDYGTKRIGVAISTPEQSLASPLENYTRRNVAVDAAVLREIADEYGVVGLVVGLPLHMHGEEGAKAREAREFGAWASSATSRPVTYWDERLTTASAQVALHQAGMSAAQSRGRLDMIAAQIMLQAYLDRVRESPSDTKEPQ